MKIENWKLKILLFCAIFLIFAFVGRKAEAAIIGKPPTNLGLVGFWSMDEGAGSYAGDSSGNKNTGTLTNGPTWVDGKRGKALNFDGVDDLVVVKNHPSWAGSYSQYTIAFWANVKEVQGYSAAIAAGNWTGQTIRIGRGDTENKWTAIVVTSGNTCNTSSPVLDYMGNLDNRFHHVVVVIDPSANRCYLYLDGVFSSQDTAVSGTVAIGTNDLYFGGFGDTSRLGSAIDDVRIYNRALSAVEVAALYKSGTIKHATPSNTGLVGYWSFDEGSGSYATDSSGNKNTGTLTNGPTWVDGKRGKALSFDGTDDYVNGGSAFNFTTSNFTIGYWIKLNSLSTDQAGQGPAPIFRGAFQVSGYYGQIGQNGQAHFITNQSSANQTSSTDTGIISAGQWYHIAYVRNGSSVGIYVNGVDKTTTAGTHSNPSSSSYNFEVGSYINGFINTNGLIDDVRIYNRALSASEIQTLYKSGAAKFAPPSNTGLVGYWSFDDGAGTSATDFSGKQNTGTLTNMDAATDWVPGKRGKALDFDGSNDYVNAGSSSSLDNLGPMTVSAWIYPRTLGYNNAGHIINKENNTNAGWVLRLNNTTANSFLFRDFGNTSNVQVTTSANTVSLNQWQHVVLTWDGSQTAANVQIYKNGAELTYQAQSNGAGGVTDDSALNLVIGCSQTCSSNLFNGLIDDVRIYNRALSASEVQALYNSR